MKKDMTTFDEGSAVTLESLKVIPSLHVGPIRLETQRLLAPYRIVSPEGEEGIEMVFRYEEDVFQPENSLSRNLAGMVAAQAALNYGLFCDRIVFHGEFDRHDRMLLASMAENTAREIYVKKFLQPNPFLKKEYGRFSPVKKDSYLQAELLFPDPTLPDPSGQRNKPAESDKEQYGILSSGGKDSLLSFGLIKELGKKAHPVFVNESGRHWFTALNAHRYFVQHHPETSRVWTNADRVFAWMLRRMPFIRQDFARVRSDEYAVRLWTVAVFLFGSLPLFRKRRIGRILIGNEYDTTLRSSYRGITHYNGLYDQSRHFDQAMSRYFLRKGWGVSLFSLLRPLSELLIEKTLLERYPELQKRQVSCHAAHVERERARPCGRCEKCRRIVGMIRALGGDPGTCGYTEIQISRCLDQWTRSEIHQEKEGAEHLTHLLVKNGIVTPSPKMAQKPREHPEIIKLRFDRERSPFDCIPADLRKGLYGILLEHAKGSMKKEGKIWKEFPLLTAPTLQVPYLFERRVSRGHENDGGRSHFLGELTWPQAKKRLLEVDIALLPVGAVEQHGPHLPLDTDAYDAAYLAREVALTCSEPRPLVMPLVAYGVSYHHEDFPGTISVGPDTLSRLIYDVGMSAAKNGITKLVIVNGHGGNSPALHFAAQMINRDAHIFTCVDTGESSDTDIDEFIETPNDVHAGEVETSTSLWTRPELVDLKSAKKFVPRFSIRYLNFTSKRGVGWYGRTARFSSSGVIGDPTRASREKGEKIWSHMIRNLAEFVEELKIITLDEIYQRRY